jgi:hypothetical protein
MTRSASTRSLLVLAAALAVTVACNRQQAGRPPKAVVLLVDRSASTLADRELYRKAAEKLQGTLGPGDRFVAGWITARSGEDLRSYLDESLPSAPPPMGVLDIPSRYKGKRQAWERDYAERIANIRAQVSQFLDAPSAAQRTHIFESLRVVAQLLAGEQRPRKLVVFLCDMVEDSDVANFEKDRLDDAVIANLIGRHQSAGILPALSGIRVFVAGARAQPLQQAAAIERFWKQYFAATGAVLAAYSRALPAFEE